MFKFATLCTLLCWIALTLSQANSQRNQVVVLRHFHQKNCNNPRDSTVQFHTHFEQCQRVAPLTHTRSECRGNQYVHYSCVDDNCKNCVERKVGENECIPEDFIKIKCDTESNISKHVNMNGALYRLSVYNNDQREPRCEDRKRVWFMIVEKNKCHEIMEGFYFSASEQRNNRASLQLFTDGQCKQPLQMMRSVPVKVNECVAGEFLPMMENVSVRLDRIESGPGSGRRGDTSL